MRIISWNVNGIRAAIKNGFMDFLNSKNADIFCLQEIKISKDDITDELRNIGKSKKYTTHWLSAEKKGYSGVAVIYKESPISIKEGIDSKFDKEGRVLTLEYEKLYLVNLYAPNSQRGLLRLNDKIDFNSIFLKYCESLRKTKPVVITGDFNVAHKEIDLKNPKENENNAGYTIEERNSFQKLLDAGYLDCFRLFNNKEGQYTWWTYRFSARARNIGWRIDYFLADKRIKDKIKSCEILNKVLGSDHCPISLEINI